MSRGEILGIAGLVGAGRTEMARAIFGADPFDAGRILVDGQAVDIRTPQQAIRHGIGLVPEDDEPAETSWSTTSAARSTSAWRAPSSSSSTCPAATSRR